MNIALTAGGLLTKYLNKFFVVSKEIITNGVITSVQNYRKLGSLLWIVIGVWFVIPIAVILKFNPNKA
ncbi:hypothetical protein [Candidatus Ruthturnera calyptogenae]|nr:hypothetical protein [Candidatus Ruthturnera calyptogenae]